MNKPLKTLLSGIGLIIVGVLIPAAVVVPLLLHKDDQTQFLVPGTAQVVAKETGRYYLWNDTDTVFQGKNYTSSADVPAGLTAGFKDESGAAIPFVADSTTSVNSNQSVGYIEITKPQTLTVTVEGKTDPRVFSVSKSAFAAGLVKIIIAFVAGGLLGFIGFLVCIWGIIRFIMGRNKGTPAVAAPANPVV